MTMLYMIGKLSNAMGCATDEYNYFTYDKDLAYEMQSVIGSDRDLYALEKKTQFMGFSNAVPIQHGGSSMVIYVVIEEMSDDDDCFLNIAYWSDSLEESKAFEALNDNMRTVMVMLGHTYGPYDIYDLDDV